MIAEAKERSMEVVKDITFGSIAGIAGKFVEYPFDTVKVRLQSQPLSRATTSLSYTGPLDCFQKSIRREGFLGLYRGISAPLLGAAIETSSLFYSYRLAQDFARSLFYFPTPSSSNVNTQLPLSVLVGCGAASGAFTSLLLTPVELVKCQLQVPLVSGRVRTRSPLEVIASVYKHHGITGFWHGQVGTLIRETGGSAAWFGSYEGVSAGLRRYKERSAQPTLALHGQEGVVATNRRGEKLPIHQQMLAGAIAGMSYNFVFYPADTIKSRMQTEELGSNAEAGRGGTRNNGFWKVGKELWREQGLKGMYRGCGITVGRAAPSSAFIFTIYERLRGLVD